MIDINKIVKDERGKFFAGPNIAERNITIEL
jgi:hypothetical protein